jgi:acetyltransferase-like isoleucine patch superfamily enzyme
MDHRYVHSSVELDSSAVLGSEVQIYQNSHIRENVTIGNNSKVGRNVYIGPGVAIGENCKIQNYALVYEPAILQRGVFIGPAVVLTNDPELWSAHQAANATIVLLDALTREQALTLSDEMRRRVRQEPLVWHGVARMTARYVGRDIRRIPPPLDNSVVVLEADDSYVRAALPAGL